jgi:hypothetical protein
VTVDIGDTIFSILSAYHSKHDLTQAPVKIDDLKPIFEERGYIDRIIWEEYDNPVKNIAAQIGFYKASLGIYKGDGDYARIQFSSSLNMCWKRFAICKEMYHCLIDNNSTARITNTTDLMKLAEFLVRNEPSVIEHFEPHDTEQLAELLALETLFPMELRQHHKADYDAGSITAHQLALRYRIPETYTEIAMYPNYFASVQLRRQGKMLEIKP